MRTVIPGKRTILVRNIEPVPVHQKKGKAVTKLVYLKINSDTYIDAVRASIAMGSILSHSLPDLHLRSLHSLLYNLELAKEMVAVLLDKPSKQLASVQKLIDNARLRTENDPENNDIRQHTMQYITEQILRYEGLGLLHGFIEVVPKKR